MNEATSPVLRFQVDDLEIDADTREVRRDGEVLDLPGLSFDLLLALVEAAPRALDHDELADRVWSGRPVRPETITQRVKLVRDALSDSSEEPRYITLVRGHGYRLKATVRRLAADEGAAIRGRMGIPMIAGLVLVTIALGSIGLIAIDRSEPTVGAPLSGPAPSIAVLPFADLSPEQNQRYFADGMSENLIHVLAQSRGLKVVAKASSFHFRHEDVTIQQIADQLGVAYVLDGGIQRSGDSIRVTTHLIDAADQTYIWSKSFQREYADIFAVQDEIAGEVAAALELSVLEPGSQRDRPSLAAYEQVMKGRHQLHAGTAESLAAAERHFKRAIELDPDYALAYVGLANAYDFQVTGSSLPAQESIELRRPLIARALELAPSSAEALATRGFWYLDRQEFDAAERDLLKAIGHNPSYARARHFYAYLLRKTGRLTEALVQARLAAELDPLSAWVQAELGKALWGLGRVDEALMVQARNVRRHPDVPVTYKYMADYLWVLGRIGESQRWLLEARRRSPESISLMKWECLRYVDLGQPAAARACLDEITATRPGSRHRYEVQSLLASYDGDWQAATALAEMRLAPSPSDGRDIRILAHLLVQQGNVERARQLLFEAYPRYFEPNAAVSRTTLDQALAVASVLHAGGEPRQRDRLFHAIEAVLPTMHRLHGVGCGITDVYIHAMRGDRDAAIAALREAADMGWRASYYVLFAAWWNLPRDWRLGNIHGDPEFMAIVKGLEEDMTRQWEWFEAHREEPISPIDTPKAESPVVLLQD